MAGASSLIRVALVLISVISVGAGQILAETLPKAEETDAWENAWTDTWKPLGGGWSLYSNERFGTRIEIPRHLFELQDPPPDNGDGRKFVSKDGARLWVYGSFSADTVVDKFEDYRPYLINLDQEDGVRITYQAGGKDWFAYSGVKEGRVISYTKVVQGCGGSHHLRIEYPAIRKRAYDALVTRMSRTLTCRSGIGAAKR